MKNITDNRIRRKKKKFEKKEDCGKHKSVCLGDVCSQVLEVELSMEQGKERCSSPELCNTTVQTINDSCSHLIEDNKSSIQNIDGNSSSLQEIYSQQLKEDCSKSIANKTSLPRICTNTAQTKNASGSTLTEENIFSTQDKELLSILEELQGASISEDIDQLVRHPSAYSPQNISINHQDPKSSNHSFSNSKIGVTNEGRLVGCFCSDTVFNLSKKLLTDTEIRVLEKCLDFSPIQNKINEPKLRTDFEDFCWRMCITWHFRNETSPAISEIPSFSPKSSRKPPRGHPNLVRYF